MVLELAEVGGMGWRTSPCSTIFSVIVQTKNVDACPVRVSRPLLVTMQHHVVALADHSFKLNVFSGIVLGHADEVGDEGLVAVGDLGIVLSVCVSRVFLDCLGGWH